jgi:hypothetical protein
MLVHDHPPRGGGALALALLTGCAGDATVTDPAIALPTLSRDSLRPSFTIAPPLEITPANEQRCESRTVEREPGGRFVRWRASQREQVTVARAAADTVLTRYEAYAFDRTGAQTAEAQCILRRGTNAKQFMRGFFERPGRGGLVGVLAEATAAPVPPGIPPVFIGVGTVCLFDVWSWQMQCGNTTCYPMFAARAPTGSGALRAGRGHGDPRGRADRAPDRRVGVSGRGAPESQRQRHVDAPPERRRGRRQWRRGWLWRRWGREWRRFVGRRVGESTGRGWWRDVVVGGEL